MPRDRFTEIAKLMLRMSRGRPVAAWEVNDLWVELLEYGPGHLWYVDATDLELV